MSGGGPRGYRSESPRREQRNARQQQQAKNQPSCPVFHFLRSFLIYETFRPYSPLMGKQGLRASTGVPRRDPRLCKYNNTCRDNQEYFPILLDNSPILA